MPVMGKKKAFLVRVGGRYEPPRWLTKPFHSGELNASPLKTKARRFARYADAAKAAEEWNYSGAGTNLLFHPATVD